MLIKNHVRTMLHRIGIYIHNNYRHRKYITLNVHLCPVNVKVRFHNVKVGLSLLKQVYVLKCKTLGPINAKAEIFTV